MDYAIQVEGLHKKFGSKKGTDAVNGLSFNIPRGQLFGLIGPDGAGKTTTLRMLSTVLKPTQGAINILGIDIVKQPEKARPLIGYMPQQFSLYPDLSVIENLNFFADLNNVRGSSRQTRIEEMLAFTRLDRFQSRKAAQLSGGMKKKLALACALVHDPGILLLDEPSTGVDPVSRRELWVMLAKVVANGVTIMVSTPYMDEADRCSQVGMIYNGSLMALGSPDELQLELPFEIIEVKAKPRKTMRRVVDQMEGVSDWRPVGDRLRLSVPSLNGNANRVLKELTRELSKEKAKVDILRSSRKTMEDVFTHSVMEARRDE